MSAAAANEAPRRRKDRHLARLLPGTWLYVVVGIPLLMLTLKHGWSHSFQDGDFSLLAVGVLTAAILEEGFELYRDRAQLTRRSWQAFALVVVIYGGAFLAPSLIYFITAGPGTGKADWVQIVVFWLTIIVAYGIRFPEQFADRNTSVETDSTDESPNGA